MDNPVKTLEYSKENIKLLESKGYTKSCMSKPYSRDKVLRYSAKRGAYWFTSRTTAHLGDCLFTQRNTGIL